MNFVKNHIQHKTYVIAVNCIMFEKLAIIDESKMCVDLPLMFSNVDATHFLRQNFLGICAESRLQY